MKILITNTGPWGTGSFTVARGILDELIELGHEVRLFFPDTMIPNGELDYYLAHKDIYKMWPFPHTNHGKTLKSFPLIIPDPHPRSTQMRTCAELSEEDFAFYRQELKEQLQRVIDEFQPDIVECQHIWLCDAIIDELNLPFVSTAHHSDQMGFRYDSRMRPIAIESASNAKYIFAVSSHVKKEVMQLYNAPQEKVIVSGNGYNRDCFRPQEHDRKAILDSFGITLPENATIVTFAGKMSRTKGIDILLEANKLLSDTNIHFLLMGSGNLLETLYPDRSDHYAFDRIHVVGHQPPEKLSQLHNIADFSVLPSRSEGFGIAVLEAMGCGLPVVVTRCGGPEDFAVGEIIEPEDPKALSQAILHLASLTPQELRKLSLRAIETAHTYSWRAIAEQRMHYYLKAR